MSDESSRGALLDRMLEGDEQEVRAALTDTYGQEAAGTVSALIELRGRIDPALARQMLELVLSGAEPLAALRAVAEHIEWCQDQGQELQRDRLERVLRLAQHGPYPRRVLRRHPGWAELDEVPEDSIRGLALDAARSEAPEQSLRQLKARQTLAIFDQELSGAPVQETTRRFSLLAEACIEAALQVAQKRVAATDGVASDESGEEVGFAVMSLGKLGGEELNYSSDVDLIFVYGTDAGEVTPPEKASSLRLKRATTLHEYFVRVGRELMNVLQKVTADGYVFRVDMRLRPGGARGPLAHSVDALLEFYESWGTTWQRSAWLKARTVAGDREVGRSVLTRMEPFVYRRFLDFSALEEIADMKRRVATHARREELRWHGVERSGRGRRRWDIKVGDGGIREVEFAVQALQLVYAGQRPELRTGNTLKAIDRLMVSGILAHADGEAIRSAYVFYRRLEHRVQMEQDRQTYWLGLDDETLQRFALRLGLVKSRLTQLLDGHRESVSRVFSSVMPAEDGPPPDVEKDLARIMELGQKEATEEDLERLRDFGFDDPDRAAHQLGALMARPYLPFHSGAPRKLRTMLLRAVLGSPDPAQALTNLTRLVTRVGTRTGYLEMLLANEQLTQLVVTLFGTSDFLSKRIASFPELIEQLSAPGWLSRTRDTGELRRLLRGQLGGIEIDDRDRRLNQLRRFKYENILRIGLRDVGELADVVQVRRELSQLADVLLEFSLEEAQLELESRFGSPIDETSGEPAPIAVMALGKLGGHELSYASDLDLVFVYEGSGRTGGGERSIPLQDFFGRLAQTLITFMSAHLREGRLYEIDTRLRPSGNQGALVTSLDGYRRYSLSEAELWERQSLLRGRFVAGNAPLGRKVEAVMHRSAFGEGKSPQSREEIATAILESRKRLMELARSPEQQKALSSNRFRRRPQSDASNFRHVKYGRGGLIDVEFTAQFLQLCHGPTEPSLRTASTLEALSAAVETGIIERRLGHILDSGYRFLLRLEDRLRIVHDQSIDGWYATEEKAAGLASRMGYAGEEAGAELIARFEEETSAVRAVFEDVVGGSANEC